MSDWEVLTPERPDHAIYETAKLVRTTLTILDTKTGVTHSGPWTDYIYETDGEWLINDFMWSDGNYSCDCNRELFFWQLVGEERDDVRCTDGRFDVRITNPRNGETVYADGILE